MLSVIALIEIAEGKMDEFMKIFLELVPKVQAEDGCVEYAPWVDFESSLGAQAPIGPNTVAVIEKWESEEALEAHLLQSHMNEFRTATKELRAGMTLHILSPPE